MRYHFHVEAGRHVCIDPLGLELADFQQAMNHAVELVCEFANDQKWFGATLRVVNSQNSEVLSLPIVDQDPAPASE